MEIFIDELIRDYSDGVYSLALRLCRNKHDADDLFQTTFLKIAEKGSLSMQRNIKSYLYTATLNLYRKKYASVKKEAVVFMEAEEINRMPSMETQPEEEYITRERHRLVRKCIREMPDKYRIPVILYYEHDFSINEIAASTGNPSGTVKTRLKKAREIIKKGLEDAQWII